MLYFSDGILYFHKIQEENNSYYIDKNGTPLTNITEKSTEKPYYFFNGFGTISCDPYLNISGQDKQGETILPTKYDSISSFSEGLIVQNIVQAF